MILTVFELRAQSNVFEKHVYSTGYSKHPVDEKLKKIIKNNGMVINIIYLTLRRYFMIDTLFLAIRNMKAGIIK